MLLYTPGREIITHTDRAKFQEILERVEGNEDAAFDLWMQYKCLTDLYFLGTEIFGWKKSTDISGKRRRVDPKFHGWLARVLQQENDKMILVGRLHLKSTWVKARIVQRILQHPNIRIGLLSVTARLVEQELAEVKRLAATPLLRRLFPDQIPDPGKDYAGWEKSTAGMLTIKRDPSLGKVPQEPQVLALGVGAKITGIHLDEIYADDILDDSTVTTPEQMKKTEDWWAYINAILELGGLTTITGTFYHYSDLYNKIIREKHFPKKNIYIRPAVENGKIIYSSWFRWKDLERFRKRMGSYIFSCQLLLNPIPREDQIFPPPHPTYTTLPRGEYQYYITVDPAATTQAYSDKTAFTIAAVNKAGFVYIVEAVQYKKPGNEIADILIKKCMQYRPVRVGIELGLQTHLQYIIESRKSAYEAANKVIVPMSIFPVPLSRKHSKGDRVNLTLGAFVRDGKFFIHESCHTLMRQMEHFTGKGKEEDDLVDSTAMVFSVVENFAYQYWMEPQFRSNKGETFMDIFKPKKPGWRDYFVA